MLFPLASHVRGSPRVVVTGAGIITSLGAGWAKNSDGFRAGRTAIRAVTLFDVAGQRAKVAAEVDLPENLPRTRLSARTVARMDRAAKLLLHAGQEAWLQTGWRPDECRRPVLPRSRPLPAVLRGDTDPSRPKWRSAWGRLINQAWNTRYS